MFFWPTTTAGQKTTMILLSFAPGADDNGSGVAALLEIARLLPKERLKCNVIIAFLSGEEHGLIGAEMLSRRAVEEKWNIVAVLNNDMIGNSTASETGEKNNSVVRVFPTIMKRFAN